MFSNVSLAFIVVTYARPGKEAWGSWTRASEKNNMAEPILELIKVTEHDVGQKPEERLVLAMLYLC